MEVHVFLKNAASLQSSTITSLSFIFRAIKLKLSKVDNAEALGLHILVIALS